MLYDKCKSKSTDPLVRILLSAFRRGRAILQEQEQEAAAPQSDEEAAERDGGAEPEEGDRV